jgi:hypothetical protein
VSLALHRAEEKGKHARAPWKRKEGGRGIAPAERHSGEDTGRGSGLGPELRARAAEKGWAVCERGKRPERERARERWLSGGTDPTVGPAGRERRQMDHCGWPARRWGPLVAGREV